MSQLLSPYQTALGGDGYKASQNLATQALLNQSGMQWIGYYQGHNQSLLGNLATHQHAQVQAMTAWLEHNTSNFRQELAAARQQNLAQAQAIRDLQTEVDKLKAELTNEQNVAAVWRGNYLNAKGQLPKKNKPANPVFTAIRSINRRPIGTLEPTVMLGSAALEA